MTDQRHSVFLDDRPDSRAPTRSPDQPVTSGEIVGAHWTLGRQDFVGAPEQAEVDAYGPIVDALVKDAPTNIFDPAINRYMIPSRTKANINGGNVWRDVAERRARDPSFLKDVPAKDEAEFKRWVQQRERQSRREAQDVVSRERGFGQTALGFGTDLAAGLADPVNLSTMFIPGGPAIRGAGAIKSIASIAARDALINTAVEVAQLPSVAKNREYYGEEMGFDEMGARVGISALAGGVFGGGIHGLGLAGRALKESDLGQRVGQRIGKAFRLGELADAPDGEIASAFRDIVPDDIRTPDDRAALAVLDEADDIARSNPFAATPAGMDAHAGALGDAIDTLLASAGRDAGAPVPAPAAATPRPSVTAPAPTNLSADRVIGFVMNTLEGGSKVVDNGEGAGTTKFGITQRYNPDVDVASLTEGQAAAIARRKYWLPEYDRLDPRIAAIAFDVGYINGFDNARRIVRESGGDPAKAIALYRDLLNGIADRSPKHAKFKKGWNNRVDRLARFVGGAGDEGRVTLRPELFDDAGELSAAQRALDEVEMDARLLEYERGRADRGDAPDLFDAIDGDRTPALDGAWEGSAAIDGEIRDAAMLAPLADDVPPPRVSDPAPAAEPLRPTVAEDAVDEVLIGPIFVAPEGRPGFQIEDPHGDGYYLSSVFRDETGAARANLRFPVTPEAREITPGVSVYVAPELRRQGVATRLYDNLRDAGHDIDALAGTDDLTPAGAAFVTARRARNARLSGEALADDIAASPAARAAPADTPALTPFDDVAGGEGVARQVDSLDHDLRVDLGDADLTAFRLTDDGSDQALSDLVAELDADAADIQTVRNCL